MGKETVMKAAKRWLAALLLAVSLFALWPEALAASYYSTSPTSSVWNTYKPSLHYLYQQLDYTEKMAFSSMYDAVALGKPELWRTNEFNLTTHQRERVYYAIQYDCPELMFADYQPTAYRPNAATFFSDSREIKKQAKVIKNYLPKVIAKLKAIQNTSAYGTSAYSHQLAFDRWMVKNCKYKLDDKKDKDGNRIVEKKLRAAYSVFLTKSAVCEGYARAAMLALRYFGIPCIYVYGDAYNGKKTEAHAWNMVQLGGKWYQYDPTWQDADKKNLLTDYCPYFNVTDSQIGTNHTLDKTDWRNLGFTLPSCYSTKYNYYVQKKQLLGSNWKSQLAAGISKAYKAKKTYVAFKFESSYYCSAAWNSISSMGNTLYRKYKIKAKAIKKMKFSMVESESIIYIKLR